MVKRLATENPVFEAGKKKNTHYFSVLTGNGL